MRVLEALKTLETAVIQCQRRDVDTLEVREALDLLEPYCETGMVSRRLSRALEASRGIRPRRRRAAASLRVYFSGIHSSVRALLAEQIGKLKCRYRKKNDAALKPR